MKLDINFKLMDTETFYKFLEVYRNCGNHIQFEEILNELHISFILDCIDNIVSYIYKHYNNDKDIIRILDIIRNKMSPIFYGTFNGILYSKMDMTNYKIFDHYYNLHNEIVVDFMVNLPWIYNKIEYSSPILIDRFLLYKNISNHDSDIYLVSNNSINKLYIEIIRKMNLKFKIKTVINRINAYTNLDCLGRIKIFDELKDLVTEDDKLTLSDFITLFPKNYYNDRFFNYLYDDGFLILEYSKNDGRNYNKEIVERLSYDTILKFKDELKIEQFYLASKIFINIDNSDYKNVPDKYIDLCENILIEYLHEHKTYIHKLKSIISEEYYKKLEDILIIKEVI